MRINGEYCFMGLGKGGGTMGSGSSAILGLRRIWDSICIPSPKYARRAMRRCVMASRSPWCDSPFRRHLSATASMSRPSSSSRRAGLRATSAPPVRKVACISSDNAASRSMLYEIIGRNGVLQLVGLGLGPPPCRPAEGWPAVDQTRELRNAKVGSTREPNPKPDYCLHVACKQALAGFC